jgi:hypothetical protein
MRQHGISGESLIVLLFRDPHPYPAFTSLLCNPTPRCVPTLPAALSVQACDLSSVPGEAFRLLTPSPPARARRELATGIQGVRLRDARCPHDTAEAAGDARVLPLIHHTRCEGTAPYLRTRIQPYIYSLSFLASQPCFVRRGATDGLDSTRLDSTRLVSLRFASIRATRCSSFARFKPSPSRHILGSNRIAPPPPHPAQLVISSDRIPNRYRYRVNHQTPIGRVSILIPGPSPLSSSFGPTTSAQPYPITRSDSMTTTDSPDRLSDHPTHLLSINTFLDQ